MGLIKSAVNFGQFVRATVTLAKGGGSLATGEVPSKTEASTVGTKANGATANPPASVVAQGTNKGWAPK